MRNLHHFWHCVLLVYICTFAFSCQKPASTPPNIIFILTDDQGWGDISAHGNEVLQTPAMDQIKAEGASFQRFYVSPLCAPTRASFLTGKYHISTGTVSVSRGLERMRGQEVTIAELLRDAGYATGCFGKWHNGSNYPENPQGQGFQQFVGFSAGHWNNYFDTRLEYNGAFKKSQGFITDVLTDESLRFIEANKQGPFFCYIPYNAPHGPFQVPDTYFDKYKEQGLEDRLAAIYGMVENLDDNIQRILDKLEELDLSENTMVIFATDNGPNGQRYNGDMKGWKGRVDEGGVRVPFFVRWPQKIQAGKQVEIMGAHIDLLPTLMEIAGLPIPSDIDGISLAPALLQSQAQSTHRYVFTHVNFMTELFPYPGAIRDGRFVLTVKQEGDELFDLFSDPGQQHNLISENPEIADSLKALYLQWFEQQSGTVTALPSIPAGHAEAGEVSLFPQEAQFTDSLQFKEGHGWANDWLINWKTTADSIWWQLQVEDSLRYRVWMEYTVPAADVGAQVLLRAGQEQLTVTIDRAHDPGYLPSPDRVPRIEVYEKEWARLDMGEITLAPGAQTITLKAREIPGSQAAEFNRLILEIPPEDQN